MERSIRSMIQYSFTPAVSYRSFLKPLSYLAVLFFSKTPVSNLRMIRIGYISDKPRKKLFRLHDTKQRGFLCSRNTKYMLK